ncbi:unnamed protein product [Cladocopium goreaui]|uniref:Uncharacterized protein n=1 Tax=Cladocopium goreaui TaxID=2562237 RepID=A0A9P1GG47_9DINO|nr:unnamed protein product [Cladocopium goreaui]
MADALMLLELDVATHQQTEDLRNALMQSLVKWKLKTTSAWGDDLESEDEGDVEGHKTFARGSLPTDLKLWANEKLSELQGFQGRNEPKTSTEVSAPKARPTSACVGRHGSG